MKVIVVGAGTMGSTHAEAYQSMPGVELAAIVDNRLEVAKRLAKKVGSKAFATLDEAVATVSFDVLDVCVPTPFHKEYILQGAKLKKHVISEKPLCLNVMDARTCIEACEKAGVRLFVGQVVRFFPEYRAIRDMITEGAIGQIGTARTYRGGQFPTAWQDWYASADMSGTLVVDLMIHDFDFLRWCFGEVERVYAKRVGEREVNRLDHAFVSLRFQNGVIAHVEGTWAIPSGFGTEIEIAGTQGLLTHKSEESTPIHLMKHTSSAEGASVAVPQSPLEHSPYYLELEHFMTCIREGIDSIVQPEDALKALEISTAAVESARTGKPVVLGTAHVGGGSQ